MASDGTAASVIPGVPASATQPSWSSDGTKIAFTSAPTGYALQSIDLDGGAVSTITTTKGITEDFYPAWSPTDDTIAFSRVSGRRVVATTDGLAGAEGVSLYGSISLYSLDHPVLNVFTVSADGTGLRRITTSQSLDATPAWSPDGRAIAFARAPTSGPIVVEAGLYVVKVASGLPRLLMRGSCRGISWRA